MPDLNFRRLARRLGEWLWRKQAVDAARAQLPRPGELAGRAYVQARLLRAIAARVADPGEPFPDGRPVAGLLSLYRDIVYWTLVAEARDSGTVASDLAGMWRQAPAGRLSAAAGNAENLESIRTTLVDMPALRSLDVREEELDRVRKFADALYEDVARPRRRFRLAVALRWFRVAALAAATLTIGFAIRAVILGPNLAAGRPLRTSSLLAGCPGEAGCADLLFHTNLENNPWVEFDLGAVARIHVVEVRNRADCCQERAVPLIVEVSVNDHTWKEVARRDREFSTWKATFPRTRARYVKLSVPRSTMLHLSDVAIR